MKLRIGILLTVLMTLPLLSAGPETTPVRQESFAGVYYVSQNRGQDVPDAGTRQRPWKSLAYAVSRVPTAEPPSRIAILVARGEYPVNALTLKENLALLGGFDDGFARRDIFRYRSILDGRGKDRLLIAAEGAQIDGFVIINGRIRGKGGAVFCNGVSCIITNNVFRNNTTLSPQPWNPQYRHEIANDGGAIYAQSGSAPVIENNLFVENFTEVGRGAAIALHGRCRGVIRGNVFLNNTTGLSDPKRSSDGGAVSVFDWSRPIIEENIFLGNRALNRNDAGGLFVALWSSPVIQRNIFVNNYCDDDGGALFVGGQEHRYDRPLDPLPASDDFFVTISRNLFIGNENPSKNSGAMRMTMETRGRFVNNITAMNTGIYFQRSEVEVVNNTILDDFLFVETKAGLRKGKIVNNIILGRFDLQVEAMVSKNLLPSPAAENNLSGEPLFIDDWLEIKAEKVTFDPTRAITEIYSSRATFSPDALVGRVVHAGGKWGVVETNTIRSIRIWGDLSGEVHFFVLPTYHLRPDSPGVDQGDGRFTPQTDMDGEARPAGQGVDIGADEVTPG